MKKRCERGETNRDRVTKRQTDRVTKKQRDNETKRQRDKETTRQGQGTGQKYILTYNYWKDKLKNERD